jgi:hypothetical protein
MTEILSKWDLRKTQLVAYNKKNTLNFEAFTVHKSEIGKMIQISERKSLEFKP